MRHKVTPGEGIDVSDLPELTPQQMKFVEGIVAGLSASDAYRAAYDTANYQASSIWVNAAKLKAHEKVRLWLDAVQAAGFVRVATKREDRIQAEAAFAARAEGAGNWGAAGGAHDRINKLAGLYVERVEITDTTVSPADRLRQYAEQRPEMAPLIEAIAAKHGLTIGKPEGETAH